MKGENQKKKNGTRKKGKKEGQMENEMGDEI